MVLQNYTRTTRHCAKSIASAEDSRNPVPGVINLSSPTPQIVVSNSLIIPAVQKVEGGIGSLQETLGLHRKGLSEKKIVMTP